MGKKVLIINSIYDAISKFSNYRIDSDDIKRLAKLIDPNTDYIIYKQKDLSLVYNINSTVIKLDDPLVEEYLNVMNKLDLLNQPYDKDFLINSDGTIDPILIELINNSENTYLINRLVGYSFVYGTSEIYQKIKKSVCHPRNLYLDINYPDFSVKDKFNNSKTITDIINCKEKYAIIGISFFHNLPNRPSVGHQISIILNISMGNGYLFDPSYKIEENLDLVKVYKSITKYLKQNLIGSYPELNIKTIDNFGCPFFYAFQSTLDDKYCISWSFYLSILFILNEDMLFEEIVKYLYNIGLKGLRVIIPRFLIWAFEKDTVKYLLTEIRIKNFIK